MSSLAAARECERPAAAVCCSFSRLASPLCTAALARDLDTLIEDPKQALDVFDFDR